MDFKIVETSEQDLAGLPGLWIKKKMPANPDVTNYAALKWRIVLGFVQSAYWPPTNSSPYAGHWFFSLWVRPILRGLGIGESLMRKVIEKARDEGGKELFCTVIHNNSAALNLYYKLGFEKTKIQYFEEVLRHQEVTLGKRYFLVLRKRLS